MSESAIFACICVLALAGWAFTVIGYTRASLAGANSVAVLQKVDALIDDRIVKTLDRIEEVRKRPMNPGRQTPRMPATDGEAATPPPDAASALNRIFGGAPFIEDQPEAQETVSV